MVFYRLSSIELCFSLPAGVLCNDNDAPAGGGGCDASKCDTAEYLQRPTCMKTCGRCSTALP
jgi:hypothetical protein